MTVLVYVPLDRAEAVALRSGSDLGSRPGCTPSAALAGTAGPEATPEEVEFVALSHAGVLALTVGTDPLRLVLAADVQPGQVTDDGNDLGQVVVGGLAWPQVQSLFADEPEATSTLARARSAAAGLGLADALALEEVDGLLAAYDLLWFAPRELDQLTG